jgi:hypothetical protein
MAQVPFRASCMKQVYRRLEQRKPWSMVFTAPGASQPADDFVVALAASPPS